MAEVLLEHLVKEFPGEGKSAPVRAVNAIDLSIRHGEFMVLVGPSGCGKTTTLRMIAGLEEISDGRVSIDGRVVNDVLPKDRDIAMVFQNYALYPHMSVYDNMAFGLKLRRMPKDEIRKRVHDAADILGIGHLLDRKPKALSGGQRQRVAVGRAIVRQPKVFLFDEPLSNLDAKMRVTMRTEISRLHARLASTMIYVTHDQVEAMTMGDRITVMKDGNIMQVAEPLELYRQPANLFVAGFIGSPPMNFLHGTVQGTAPGLSFAENNRAATPVAFPLNAELARRSASHAGGEIVFGIRPEDIALADASAPGPEQPEFEAVIDVAEPMGAETFLYLTTGAHTLIARVRAEQRFEMNQRVRLRFDLANAHVFDPATEAVLL